MNDRHSMSWKRLVRVLENCENSISILMVPYLEGHYEKLIPQFKVTTYIAMILMVHTDRKSSQTISVVGVEQNQCWSNAPPGLNMAYPSYNVIKKMYLFKALFTTYIFSSIRFSGCPVCVCHFRIVSPEKLATFKLMQTNPVVAITVHHHWLNESCSKR